ncbi:MAG: CsbD family protein [Bdellovibrionaceae bacterium]|nr:CsbD family protein [Pseudobdellovibrionaceae bacterium]
MEVNQNILKGKWTEIKGEVQKAWGKLTNDELEQTKGDLTAIKGLIQQKYGKTQEDFSEKLTGIVDRFSKDREKTAESVKESLKSKN